MFDKVPDTALVAVKVANLEATSKKIAQLAKDFGIDGFVPGAADPLGAMQNQLGLTKGLNKQGELAFAYFDPKSNGAEPDEGKSFVMLIPVSNYKEFVSNFQNPKTEGDVTEAQFPKDNNPEPAYLADWGEYAAISPIKELVGKKPAGTLKLSGLSAKQAGKQDFLVYANFKKLGPTLLPQLNEAADKAMGEIEKSESKEIDPKYKPLIKTSMTQLFNVARTFLDNTDAATVGISIVDAGINTSVIADFKPDSYLGKFASTLKGTDAPLTIGLPNLRYLAYAGGSYDSGAISKVTSDLTQPIVDELNKIEGLDNVKQLATNMQAAMKANSGFVSGVVAPTKIGDDALLQQVAIYKGGGKDYVQVFDSAGTFAKQLLADAKPKDGKPLPKLTTTANATTIDGVAFNRVAVDMNMPKDDPETMQTERMMGVMYGASGLTYTYAAVGDDLVLGSAAKDATIASFIKANKAQENNLAKLEHIQATAAQLPKTRLYAGYLALDEMVNRRRRRGGRNGHAAADAAAPGTPAAWSDPRSGGRSVSV